MKWPFFKVTLKSYSNKSENWGLVTIKHMTFAWSNLFSMHLFKIFLILSLSVHSGLTSVLMVKPLYPCRCAPWGRQELRSLQGCPWRRRAAWSPPWAYQQGPHTSPASTWKRWCAPQASASSVVVKSASRKQDNAFYEAADIAESLKICLDSIIYSKKASTKYLISYAFVLW